MQKVKVLKFGGTSVATTDKINDIAKFIKQINCKVVVVVSAMNKETDELIELSKKMGKKNYSREMDMLLATGEQKSSSLLSMALNNLEVKSISLGAYHLDIETEGVHSKSKIKNISEEKLNSYLKDYDVLVVSGFQGVNERNDLTTLGRGGSDTSSICLGAKLKNDVYIYTDVDGFYTCDPRIVNNSKKIDEISFDVAMEMSNNGSGVMEVRSLEIAKRNNIDVYVGKSLSNIKPTRITNRSINMETKEVQGLSVIKEVIYIKINSYDVQLSKFYKLLDENEIKIYSFSETDNNYSFVVEKDEAIYLKELLKSNDINVIEEVQQLSRLTLSGVGLDSSNEVKHKLFDLLDKENIVYYKVISSQLSITFVIYDKDLHRSSKIICESFGLVN